jgi:hypothetical protein
MDSEDASYYAESISGLEKEQIDFLKLSKEQIFLNKPEVNELYLISCVRNEKVLSKGLEEMAKHINEYDGEIKNAFSGTSMLPTVN